MAENRGAPVFRDTDNHKVDEIIRIFKTSHTFFQDYFLDELIDIYECEKTRGAVPDGDPQA